MSQSLATLSHSRELYCRPRNPVSRPLLFQREYEKFLLSTENVLAAVAAAATVKGNSEDHEAALNPEHRDTLRSDEVLEQQINACGLKSVEGMEKWLKSVSEPISSTKFSKNVDSGPSMERYLSKHLPEIFFDKNFAAADSNLMNKALTVNCNVTLNNVPNERLISSSEKAYVFKLPDLQLDNLNQLTCCANDMILTSEILPTLCDSLPCTNENVKGKGFITRLQETVNISDNNEIVNKENNDNKSDNKVMHLENYAQKDFCNNSLRANTKDLSTNNVSCKKSNINDLNDCSDLTNKDVHTTESHSSTLLASNPTKPTSMHTKLKKIHSNERSSIQHHIIKQKNAVLDKIYTRSMKKNLSVDNNLTNKQLNNSVVTNKNSESLKCQSSERVKLRKRSSTSDSQESEQENNFISKRRLDCYPQELVIIEALETVGITDNKLQHFRSKDNIKMWRCHQDNCTRQFEKPSHLKIHLLTHFGIKPFKCNYDECSWAFYSNDKLLRHKKFHVKRKEFVCSQSGCKRRFSTFQNLTHHEESHLRFQIICQVPGCSDKFQTQRRMELHMKTHDDVLPHYVCSYKNCGKRCYTKSALGAHQRCHSYSDSDLTCSWKGCGKIFKHPCQLKTHMRFHTGHKPYACTFKGCKWAFSTASKLTRHQKKHTNNRDFICNIGDCKKSFVQLDDLKYHKLTHEEKRCFRCDYCDATFYHKNNLCTHIKKHSFKDIISRGQNKRKKIKKENISKKTEVRCIQVQRISTNILNKTALNNVSSNDQSTTDLSIPLMERTENNDDMYHCPIDTCTSWYPTKSSLRIHMRRKHKRPLSEIQNYRKTHAVSSSLLRDDSVMNDSPIDEPDTQGPYNSMDIEEIVQSFDENQASAETAFTCEIISSFNSNNLIEETNSVVLPNDSLPLTDDLPFIYSPGDINVGAYEILSIDREPVNIEISMHDLE